MPIEASGWIEIYSSKKMNIVKRDMGQGQYPKSAN